MKTALELWTITVFMFVVFSIGRFIMLAWEGVYLESLVWGVAVLMYFGGELLIVQSQIKLKVTRLTETLVELLSKMKS